MNVDVSLKTGGGEEDQHTKKRANDGISVKGNKIKRRRTINEE